VAARKRRPKPGRRHGFRGGWRVIALFLAAISLLIIAQRTRHTSQRVNPRRSPAVDAGRITARYTAILEREGRGRIWIKRAPQPGSDHQPPLTGEVLALPPASVAILSSFDDQAARDGLTLQVTRGQTGPSQTRTLTLLRNEKPICGWRVREVARLYRAAIIIDDLGEDVKIARKALRLPAPVTLSILPYLPASEQAAAEAHHAGREVMLHLPMEPLSEAKDRLGKGAIREGMLGLEVERVVASDLGSVPFASGVNNHMGSRATADGPLMSEVMKTLASRGLYFVDSRTTVASVALRAAREAGLPAFYRSVFLDDVQSVEYTRGELRRLCGIVRQQGVALAIGHPHRTTLAALERFLPELDREDIELVPASEIVRLPEAASLSPPRGPAITGED
jgi:polysaccharide deacetylase 2 family uncharacterized protein YibQ